MVSGVPPASSDTSLILAEAVIAAKGGDKLQLVRETADLWFHCLIMLAHAGLGPDDVLAELRRREGISGVDEKAARGR